MSVTLKPRLWSRVWESASPIASRTCRQQPFASATSNTPYSHISKRAFSSTRQSLPQRPPRRPVISKSFASCAILFFDASSTTTASASVISACTTSAEKTLYTTTRILRPSVNLLAQQAWRREIHSSGRKQERSNGRRSNSSTNFGQNGRKLHDGNRKAPQGTKKPEKSIPESTKPAYNSYLHLPHLPKMPHRPTKEELLAAATGFWSRLKVRFKWFSIRSARPWNIDDWSAFVSWFVVGNIVWVLVGTTTFFSLVILTINTVIAQETLARWFGDYLTHSAGIKVVFESAVVPKWRDGVITFHNVFVSRRPGLGKSKVSKGSSTTAAAAAAAERESEQGAGREEEDTNYTQFDITIDTVNVTLSFVKWWNGRGLLRDVEVKGVRGVVDRTSVHNPLEYVDPRTYRHVHNPGDFEINSFKLEDLLLTIHQPRGFRPFSVSIFSCELPQLRKQWLFYDFLSASNISGSFDGSLFTIHPRQVHGFAGSTAGDEAPVGEAIPWKKHSRLRIDGLKIEHLNRGVEGPFGWIHEGNVDIVADVMFPADTDDSIAKVMSDFYDRMEATVTSNRYLPLLENNPNTADLNTPENKAAIAAKLSRDDDKRFLVMDLRVHLNDVKAVVPLFTRDLSYINQALVRPIVAYINSKKTFIPINCRIVKRASEFDGSWTIFDSGLMEDLSAETYEAFAKDVVDKQARMRRLRKVGFWSISMAIQTLFKGIIGAAA